MLEVASVFERTGLVVVVEVDGIELDVDVVELNTSVVLDKTTVGEVPELSLVAAVALDSGVVEPALGHRELTPLPSKN